VVTNSENIFKGKGKINHLMNNLPSLEDLKFTLWDEEDYDYVMAMKLYNAKVYEPYMFMITTKNILSLFQSEGCYVDL